MTVRDLLLSIELEGGASHGEVFHFSDYRDLDAGFLRVHVFSGEVGPDPADPHWPLITCISRAVEYRWSGRVSERGRRVYVVS